MGTSTVVRTVLLCVAACWAAAALDLDSSSTTAVLSDAGTLLLALQDEQVTHISVADSFPVGSTFDQYVGSPLPLYRNVTIIGLHGTEDVLDLEYKRALVRICPTCTVTFSNITVANERRGNGSPYDFFIGTGEGGAVLTRDMYRLRRACTSAQDSADVVNAAARSTKIMLNTTRQQLTTEVDVTFKGRQYPASLKLIDYSVDQPLSVEEGRGLAGGGYSLSEVNVTRICQHTVSPSCLATKAPAACVNDEIDRALEQERAAAGGAGQTAPGNLAAAVAVPVVVAGLLLLAGAGLLWVRRRRRSRSQRSCIEAALPAPGAGSMGDGTATQRHLESGPHLGGSPGGHNPGEFRQPMGERHGWERTYVATTPQMLVDADAKILFGDLLGAGSYGRVYKAYWAGRHLAVKIIEHDADSTAAVENEVALMLSFNHPNIVRALHSRTYTRTASSTTGSRSGMGSTGNVWPSEAPLPAGAATAAAAGHGSTGSGTPDATAAAAARGHSSGGRGASSNQNGSATAAPAAAAGSNDLQVPHEQASDAAEQQQGQQQPAGAAPGAAAADAARTSRMCSSSGGVGKIDPRSRAETWLVQEYCDCGTLASIANSWVGKQQDMQTMLRRLLLLQDAAQGLQVLHSRSVVHGGLNARNVLVSSSAVAQFGMVAKLADLGLSRVIKQHKTHRTTHTVGTMSHMPPELLRYGRMSPAVDIYAFGVMMWELFTGQPAFKKLHYGQFFEAIVLQNLRPAVPPHMPNDYKALMQQCWAADPASRPNTHLVLQSLEWMIQQRQRHLAASAATVGAHAAQSTRPGASPLALALQIPLNPQHQQQGQQLGQQQGLPGPGDAGSRAVSYSTVEFACETPAARDVQCSVASPLVQSTGSALATGSFHMSGPQEHQQQVQQQEQQRHQQEQH